jgi:hypothetical protein
MLRDELLLKRRGDVEQGSGPLDSLPIGSQASRARSLVKVQDQPSQPNKVSISS